jgi:phosphoserine phosphatase
VLIVRLIAEVTGMRAQMEACLAELAARGVSGTATCLGPQGALQIAFDSAEAADVRAVFDAHFAPADLLIADHAPTIPHVFISDMDSTMISAECIDELADFAGIKPQIAVITERAMQGELDFGQALRERVALLAGLGEDAIARCLSERIFAMPGAKTLVATLKAKGCRTVLVTGGFHQFADPVAAELGFEHVVANRLEVADGKLTGGLVGPICDSATKKATLLAELAGLGEGAISLATGDGANDIPMIEAATYGIAYRAKPKARAAANGAVDFGDLTAVLTLLGIPESEWVRG